MPPIILKFDTIFYFVTAVISVLRNAMQGLGETVIPLVSSALEMIGKVVIAVTLVPLLGYTGVIVAEPIVWVIMVIPLIVKILKMPELKKQSERFEDPMRKIRVKNKKHIVWNEPPPESMTFGVVQP